MDNANTANTFEGTADWSTPGASQGEKEDLANLKERARQQAQQFGAAAADKLDAGRTKLAESLEKSAAGLRERADRMEGRGRTSAMARTAADKLGSTAGYLRTHDSRMVGRDAVDYVRSHPTQSLIGAAVAGFLLGRAMKSR